MGQLAKRGIHTPEQILAAHLDSWEAHVSAWISERNRRDRSQFVMGLIASSAETKYGQSSLAKLASETGDGVSTMYLYRDVYRKCAQLSNQLETLGWTHFVLAVRAQLPDAEREALLIEAADNGWTTPQLKREIGIRRVTRELDQKQLLHLDPQMAAAISHWQELKGAVERFAKANPQFAQYASDFIGDVDEDITDPWDSGRAYIERQIFKGYREVDALAKLARWKPETVTRLCEELVALGTHEWREQGGKTDEARGARRSLIVPVTEPSGDSYEVYHGDRMSLMADDDEK